MVMQQCMDASNACKNSAIKTKWDLMQLAQNVQGRVTVDSC